MSGTTPSIAELSAEHLACRAELARLSAEFEATGKADWDALVDLNRRLHREKALVEASPEYQAAKRAQERKNRRRPRWHGR